MKFLQPTTIFNVCLLWVEIHNGTKSVAELIKLLILLRKNFCIFVFPSKKPNLKFSKKVRLYQYVSVVLLHFSSPYAKSVARQLFLPTCANYFYRFFGKKIWEIIDQFSGYFPSSIFSFFSLSFLFSCFETNSCLAVVIL